MFVKVGDKVRVISGKDKGKEGTIKQTLAKKNRVVVEGINMIKNIKSLTMQILKVEFLILKHQSMFQT